MIAITFALRSESSEFLRRLDNRKRVTANVSEGRIAGAHVCVLHTGVGEKATRPRIAEFLRDNTPNSLISSGFAGGLAEDLSAGELLLSKNFSAVDLCAVAQLALQNFAIRVGQLSTAASIVHSAGERAARAAAEGAVAVDMETKFIAEACAARSVPMLSLRVISDTPRTPFPAQPEVLFDIERQRTYYAPLLLHLAAHPTAIGKFLTFGRQIADARRVLADALCCLLEHSTIRPPVA